MSKTSFKTLIASETPVVVDFYADWCGPCKVFSPILQELKSEVGDQVQIVKIDVDKNQELSGKLGVQSIPTVMIFQKGELKWRAAGVQTLPTLKQQLAQLA
ncbi:MAG: thiol reductase thioredoxin [Saprospiraceae bacterium]|nr:MAG: thiol reductase thioredoxin [Saprospiraceae bacterium]